MERTLSVIPVRVTLKLPLGRGRGSCPRKPAGLRLPKIVASFDADLPQKKSRYFLRRFCGIVPW